MDPNEVLKELRQIASRVCDAVDHDKDPSVEDGLLLAEKFIALDEWMSNKGFSPWSKE